MFSFLIVSFEVNYLRVPIEYRENEQQHIISLKLVNQMSFDVFEAHHVF